MTEVKIGKIQSAKFGIGGYQEAMIGASFTLSGKGWGIGDFWGFWGIERSEYCKWTEESRTKFLGEVVLRLNELMKKAKVSDFNDLINVPVEVVINNNNTLQSWRILEEVL